MKFGTHTDALTIFVDSELHYCTFVIHLDQFSSNGAFGYQSLHLDSRWSRQSLPALAEDIIMNTFENRYPRSNPGYLIAKIVQLEENGQIGREKVIFGD